MNCNQTTRESRLPAPAQPPSTATYAKTIDALISELLQGSNSCALVDYPNYANIGDSAIWLGTTACLKRLGVRLRYVCDRLTYDKSEMASRIDRKTPILMQGGGNFGDVWPAHQPFREEVIRAFPNNPIVIMPQTIFFEKDENLVRAKKIINAHERLTILVRDHRSLELARSEFRTRSLLCPDMAFAIDRLDRQIDPAEDVLMLMRTDKESRFSAVLAEHNVTDWPDETSKFVSVKRLLTGHDDRTASLWHRTHLTRPAIYNALARHRFNLGCSVLARGKVVLTDRLHAHILCLMMDIPHVVLDNSYGKLASFYQTWSTSNPLCHWADTFPDAIATTQDISGRGN